jgi:glycosyltransferase involved in cell wall biosynthesis
MIDILIATFNGERYISDQINSILSQTYCEWRLLIHDDGSTDRTIEIIKKYQEKYPGRIIIFEDGIVGLGAKDNFSYLLSKSIAKYTMFCDQDDVWLPRKIERTFNVMLELESSAVDNTAIGVFTDLKVVDNNLNIIAESAWNYQKNSPELSDNIKLLAFRNYITGCTLMINYHAKKISTPIPNKAIMHDWWIGLCILKNGGILKSVHESTILYRQHDHNEVGASKFSIYFIIHRLLDIKKFALDQVAVYNQAKDLGIKINPMSYIFYKIYTIFLVVFFK